MNGKMSKKLRYGKRNINIEAKYSLHRVGIWICPRASAILFLKELGGKSEFYERKGSCTMKMRKQKTWQHEVTGIDGNTILFGVNIFDYQWKPAGQRVKVRDPLYNQEYEFPVYTAVINGEEHEFAAGEFSNCVWGFFLLKY